MNDDRGGMTAELAVLTPLLVLCMLFVVVAGRVGQARQDVTQAAAEAARTASLARGTAALDVHDTVRRNLTAAGVDCRDLAVSTAGSDRRPGGHVLVDVRCEVDLTAVAGFGLPRHRVVTARAVEVIDTYRGGD